MVTELRAKSQITIPKQIISKLGLPEGDKLDIDEKDGAITIVPVVVYSKQEIENVRVKIAEMRKNIKNLKPAQLIELDELLKKLDGGNSK